VRQRHAGLEIPQENICRATLKAGSEAGENSTRTSDEFVFFSFKLNVSVSSSDF
jgi:hypothetical protein